MMSLNDISMKDLMNFYYILKKLDIIEFQNVKFAIENEVKKRKLDEKRK